MAKIPFNKEEAALEARVTAVEAVVGIAPAANVAVLTENSGSIGGTNDGNLPDLTATYVARTGQTGTANGAYEVIGATNGGDVSGAIANNIRELDTVVQQLAADNVALRASERENAAKINALINSLVTAGLVDGP